MRNRYEESLHVLGLEPGATEKAVKEAYRDLIKVWHPDRFGSDARLREKAQDKLKEVNAAFEQLRGYRASDFTGPRGSARPGSDAREPRGSAREPGGRAQGSGGSASAFGGASVTPPPVEPANAGRSGKNLHILLAAVGLAATVGVSLFVLRSRGPQQLSPAHGQSDVAASATTRPVRAARQTAPAEPESSVGSDGESRGASKQATTGSLIVSSRPMRARVWFDGRSVGETPMTMMEVAPGEHQVEITLDGNAYQQWSSSVVVTAGREEKLLAVLIPADEQR